MAEYTPLTNIRGAAARITGVTAESVPADAGAQVAMTGPDQGRQFAFKVPRGLPGVNAIENDAAVATYLGATDSQTNAAANKTVRQTRGPGLSPFHPMFGAIGDGVNDDGPALQAFLDYVTANDVGTANVAGNFRSSIALTLGASPTKVFSGRCQITFVGTGGIGLTVNNWQSGYWEYVRLVAPSISVIDYASKTWNTGLMLTGTTSRTQFGRIEGANWSFALIVGSGGNTNMTGLGNIRANDCGSGHLTGGLTTTWSNPVNTGSQGSNSQRATINVDTLPPDFIQDGRYGAVGVSAYFIRLTNNAGKTRLHYIYGIDAANKTLSIFPWVDPATTPTTARYVYGGAVYLRGSDTNLYSHELIDAVRCGSGGSFGALYQPVGRRIVTQACGAGVIVGQAPSSASVGGRIDGAYFETNFEDVIYACRTSGTNFHHSISSDYAMNFEKVYVAAAARDNTYVDAAGSDGIENVAFDIRGKRHRFEKYSRSGSTATTQNIKLDRVDMQVPLFGNGFNITPTLDENLNRMFGYDTITFLIASLAGGAPSGTTTFTAPTGWTLNGAAGVGGAAASLSFSGLTAPTRFTVWFNVITKNLVVIKL